MPSPRLICKSGYITDNSYFMNLLEYSGNKLASQRLVFWDGSTREVDVDKVIRLTAGELTEVVGVHLCFKDGGGRTISYDTYLDKTVERQQMIRYSDVVTVQNDSQSFDGNSGPHEMKDLDFFKYLNYIEGRPGVEKDDDHGLFGLTGNIPIGDARAMAEVHERSRKWSHIISMDAEDAARTGFDRRAMWQNLIVSKAPEIAETYHINLENLVINCAFHGNTDNPHVHLMFYSKDAAEGFIKGGTKALNEATEKLKSTLVNEIFKGETATLGKEKSAYRKALMERLQKWTVSIMQASVDDDLLCKFEQLSVDLDGLAGKKVYELLPPVMKAQVDDILQAALAATPELAAVYEEYCKVQGQFIGRYISSPERLQDRLCDFQERFVHPGKDDLKQHHNIIVTAALELARQHTASLRTFEGKIADSIIPDIPLSTPNLQEPKGAERTFEGEIDDSIMSDFPLSTPDVQEETNEPRTFEEKNENYIMPPPELSMGICQEADRSLSALTMKKVAKIFRGSMVGIFNPKLPSTMLQSRMLKLLHDLEVGHGSGQPGVMPEIYRMLYTADNDFRDAMDKLLAETSANQQKEHGAEAAHLYMMDLRQGLDEGSSICLKGIDLFVHPLADQQYFQLMEAYKELNLPLNKSIRKHLYQAVPKDHELELLLRNIGDVEELLSDTDCNAYARDNVRQLMERLRAFPDLSAVFDQFEENVTTVFERNMETRDSRRYCKRFLNTFREVKRLMRPHYILVQFGRNVDDILCADVIQDAELQKDLKRSLREHLDFALTDTNSFSSVLLRRQLEKLRSTSDSEIAGEIVRYLYQTSDAFREETDRHLQCVETKLHAVVETDKVKDYLVRYWEDLFQGKYTPLSSSISWYAKCLDENWYRVLLHENKPLLKDYHSKIYKGLFAALENEGGLAQLRKLQTMLRDSPDSTQEISAMVKALMLRAYDKDDPAKAVHVLAEDAERIEAAFAPIFEKHTDTNTALMLSERLASDLWNGETPAAGFIIREFATNVEENILAGFLKKQFSSTAVKTYRHQLYNALQRVYNKNAAEAEHLRLLSAHPMTRPQFDEALAILSTPQNDLLGSRESLCQALYKEYQATVKPPLPYDEYQKIAERFFYGEGGDSFFFQEPVVAAANGELPLMTSIFPWKGLVVGLMRSIAGLSASARESDRKGHGNGFEAKRQFKNLKFHPEYLAEP